MTLKAIKSKIRSVEKTHQVTKAIEAVSAAKMRRAQEAALVARPYARTAFSILKRVSTSKHILTKARPVKKTLVVLVMSDRGLAGNLNNAMLKETVRMFHNKELTTKNTGIITIGKKGYEYFSKRGYSIEQNFPFFDKNISTEILEKLTNELVLRFVTRAYDEIVVVYTNFISTFVQEPVVRKILPIDIQSVTDIIQGIVPERGKYAEKNTTDNDLKGKYVFEPDQTKVLDELLPFLIRIELYHSILEAAASEHSARMVAMKNAASKAKDMIKDLTLTYNKERQSIITREMGEIIGGIEALT
jgi:F-type H+-transporting ATPase subunit gamma